MNRPAAGPGRRARLRSLLYVTNACPPEDFAGTPRVAKTVKHLLRAGVAVRILSTHPRAGHLDPTLLPDLEGAEVVRAVRLHPGPLVELAKRLLSRFRPGSGSLPASPGGGGGGAVGLYNRLHACLFVPDEAIGWLPFALPAGERMIRRERPGLVLSTGPDHACHLVAALLARRHRIPHVAEFRDPWTENPLRPAPTPLHARLDARLERFVLDGAAGVVTIGETLSAALRARARCPVETVYNGYDPDEFAGTGTAERGSPARPRDGPPLVAHAGRFYAGRSPRPFLEALARRRAADGPPPRALFIGPGEAAIRESARDAGVADLVEATGPLPRAECLRRLRGADLLLLVPGPGEGTITGKVFEYLALGRPILALARPAQEVARLLAAHPAHAVAPPDDPAAVDAALARCLAARDAPPRPDPRFGRPCQTARLLRFLESVALR